MDKSTTPSPPGSGNIPPLATPPPSLEKKTPVLGDDKQKPSEAEENKWDVTSGNGTNRGGSLENLRDAIEKMQMLREQSKDDFLGEWKRVKKDLRTLRKWDHGKDDTYLKFAARQQDWGLRLVTQAEEFIREVEQERWEDPLSEWDREIFRKLKNLMRQFRQEKFGSREF